MMNTSITLPQRYLRKDAGKYRESSCPREFCIRCTTRIQLGCSTSQLVESKPRRIRSCWRLLSFELFVPESCHRFQPHSPNSGKQSGQDAGEHQHERSSGQSHGIGKGKCEEHIREDARSGDSKGKSYPNADERQVKGFMKNQAENAGAL